MAAAVVLAVQHGRARRGEGDEDDDHGHRRRERDDRDRRRRDRDRHRDRDHDRRDKSRRRRRDDAEDTDKEPKIPKEVLERFQKAKSLEVIQKINQGDFENILLEEVEDLVKVLRDPNELKNKIKLRIIEDFLTCDDMLDKPLNDDQIHTTLGAFKPEPMEGGDSAAVDDVLISAQELHDAFTDEFTVKTLRLRHTVYRLQYEEEEAEGRRMDETERLEQIEVQRDDFVRHVTYTVERDDAFMTLPMTLVYIMFFILLVNGHLQIYERQLMERSLENWLNGNDPNNMATLNVNDYASFWNWVEEVAIPGTLGDAQYQPNINNNFNMYYLASRHGIVGDIKLEAWEFSGKYHYEWLLHHDAAIDWLQKNPKDYDSAALATVKYLQESWNTSQIYYLTLSFCTYDEFAQSWTITAAYVTLDKYGSAVVVLNSDAFIFRPYGSKGDFSWFIAIMDICFVSLVLYMAVQESKDAFASLRLGIGEFRQYLQVWNIVDWCSIGCSLSCCCLWLVCVLLMLAKDLEDIIDDSGNVGLDTMDISVFSAKRCQIIYSRIELIIEMFTVLHWIMAINTCSIVMKFFKAFQSNPRLKVVTDTFKEASTDLAHFFIIFLTMFLPFTIIGHILFGNDVPQMGSIMSSINSGVALLMGDFGWYDNFAPQTFTSTLPSGMPSLVLFAWFFLFNFMMVLVVLNMLLAVVLEHYTKITSALKNESDAPEIWVQVRRYLEFMKQTRGFISMETIGRELENDEDPAHPDQLVTKESLQEAWKGMSDSQAEWYMAELRKSVDSHRHREDMQDETANHQPAILECVQSNAERLAEIAEKIGSPNPALMKKVEMLLKGVNDLKSDQAATRRRLEQAIARMPKDPNAGVAVAAATFKSLLKGASAFTGVPVKALATAPATHHQDSKDDHHKEREKDKGKDVDKSKDADRDKPRERDKERRREKSSSGGNHSSSGNHSREKGPGASRE